MALCNLGKLFMGILSSAGSEITGSGVPPPCAQAPPPPFSIGEFSPYQPKIPKDFHRCGPSTMNISSVSEIFV
jgi:hypothetical protein